MPEREVVQRGRLLVWEALFAVHYSAEETLGAYAHTLVFEAGQGLDAAAAFYYRKRPADLTDDEALALVVMDLNPKGYSMRENPMRLAEAVRQFEEGRRPTRR
jgi:membrane carboxypeptidase/penicillin-binding protein PbpC